MTDQTEFLPTEFLPPTFVAGKFDYIKPCDDHYKLMLVNAYQAITMTETWDFVKQECISFMLSNDPRVNMIYTKMEDLGYSGHSGGSFGCIMRDMQYISLFGEEKFKANYLSR